MNEIEDLMMARFLSQPSASPAATTAGAILSASFGGGGALPEAGAGPTDLPEDDASDRTVLVAPGPDPAHTWLVASSTAPPATATAADHDAGASPFLPSPAAKADESVPAWAMATATPFHAAPVLAPPAPAAPAVHKPGNPFLAAGPPETAAEPVPVPVPAMVPVTAGRVVPLVGVAPAAGPLKAHTAPRQVGNPFARGVHDGGMVVGSPGFPVPAPIPVPAAAPSPAVAQPASPVRSPARSAAPRPPGPANPFVPAGAFVAGRGPPLRPPPPPAAAGPAVTLKQSEVGAGFAVMDGRGRCALTPSGHGGLQALDLVRLYAASTQHLAGQKIATPEGVAAMDAAALRKLADTLGDLCAARSSRLVEVRAGKPAMPAAPSVPGGGAGSFIFTHSRLLIFDIAY